jgi:hypothetical protein
MFFAEAPPIDSGKLLKLIATWPGAKLGAQGKTLSAPLPPGTALDASRVVLEKLRSARIDPL